MHKWGVQGHAGLRRRRAHSSGRQREARKQLYMVSMYGREGDAIERPKAGFDGRESPLA